MRGWWLAVLRLFRWRSSEREIDEELRFHVEMETETYVREGVGRAEARRRALVALGGQERWREETRSARRTAWVEDATRDIRFAVRGLLRAPAFALAALATITLGVGATTAIFSVVRGVVLAPLPYPEPDELVTVWMRNLAENIEEDITSWPNFLDWREGSTLLEAMATVRDVSPSLTGAGDPEELRAAAVSRGFFELIGAPLEIGRTFRDGEVEGDAARVVVLSHELFERRFGSDPSIVGRTIQLNDAGYEVVGVTAPGLRYPRDAELWLPQSLGGDFEGLREARSALWLPVIGRLTDGVDLAAAQAEVDAIARRLEAEYPAANEGVGITLEPLHETLVGDVRTPMLVLLAAVALVLLIAVVNVANLLLARGTARARELAVRLTLGAGRGRIVRQVLAESAVLGVAGMVAGTAVSVLAVRMLLALAPPGLPRIDQVDVDAASLGFGLLVAVGASILFGLVPALHAGRVEPGEQLREGSRGSSGAGLARLRAAFVVAQFALALLLLVGAGLLGRSFLELRSVEPGFEPENVLSVTLSLPPGRYPDPETRRTFYDQLHQELAAVPGVTEVGTISTLFLQALPNMGRVFIESRPELYESMREFPVVQDAASPGFFGAAGMRIVAGRAPDERDGPDDASVAVVNEAFVRVFLADVDPVGERFMWGRPSDDDTQWVTIVGVVADARRSGLDQAVRPSAFLPVAQAPQRRLDALVRTAGDPLAVVPGVRQAVQAIDDQLPLTRVRTLEQAMSEALSGRRFVAWLLALFAGSALALAAVGIFGVMAYLVGQRTREIGIRVALGAERSSVLSSVLREGMLHAGLGLVLGAVGALAMTRFMRSQLFGLEPTDPATFAISGGVLLAVAALACLIPARRAAGVDPVVALREE
jgi:putative ABC transport system permease protein